MFEKIKRIFKKEEEETQEGFLEIEKASEERSKLGVRIEELKDYADTERILNFLREGNVVFLRIGELRKKDINQLKRAVEKIKKVCAATEGDIVGVDEDFLIITPKPVKIWRD